MSCLTVTFDTFNAVTGYFAPARIAAAGNGVDDLVKVDGQWLIKFRNVSAPDDK